MYQKEFLPVFRKICCTANYFFTTFVCIGYT
jgi:hypothetical protein